MLIIDDANVIKGHDLSFLNSSLFSKKEKDDKFVLKIPPEGMKIDLVVKELILKTLKITNGNQVQAAKVLGLSRSKLRYRMEQLGISVTKNIN